ncbi:GNAT family N-acetyltransferase [Actinoplanes sp. TBRC 11911]|uniref:GNAT family N-acetyltransferase n=1 Tax=Actinoplanes sp. TBRC 11911 TaxID=2729386 RepID=UPI00145F90B6|nr:GNAT family N-acetyltransferase [Actinoplanes sp. TBRC 11911]NMO55368.1 GNAT family N-acetyltransferase [Actinoplanes sp. TBRC 11911]
MLAAHRAYLLGWNIDAANDTTLVTYRSGVRHATLNGVLRVARRSQEEAFAEARERLDGVPRIWWAGPDSDPETPSQLLGLGAVLIARLPIMAVAVDDVEPEKVPNGLRISEATDVEEFVAAYGKVSGIPADAIPVAIEREKAFSGDGTVVRLAGRFEDGKIAGTTVAWFSHNLLTLYFVGTQPHQRRRGVGKAMTLAAIDLARQRGIRTAALTSSAVAQPLYHRVGFRTVGSFNLMLF